MFFAPADIPTLLLHGVLNTPISLFILASNRVDAQGNVATAARSVSVYAWERDLGGCLLFSTKGAIE